MTSWQLPTEPPVDRLWTTARLEAEVPGEVIEWRRATGVERSRGDRPWIAVTGRNAHAYWDELLTGYARVDDADPAVTSVPVYEPSEQDVADDDLGAVDYLGWDGEAWTDEPELDDDSDGWRDGQDDYERLINRWGGAA